MDSELYFNKFFLGTQPKDLRPNIGDNTRSCREENLLNSCSCGQGEKSAHMRREHRDLIMGLK